VNDGSYPVVTGSNVPIIPLYPYVPYGDDYENWFKFAYPFGGLTRTLGVTWDCICNPTTAALNPKKWVEQRKVYKFRRDGLKLLE